MAVDVQIDEPIYYWAWETDHHQVYEGVVRVLPADAGHPQHPKVHIRCFDESANGFFNVNNVLNIEIADPDGTGLDGISYWTRRFADWEPE